MPKKDKKNSDHHEFIPKEEDRLFAKSSPNVSRKKLRSRNWLFLTIILIAILILILAYKSGNNTSPFENKILQTLSLQNFPFMERQSFFFPPEPNEKIILETPVENKVLEEASSMKKSKSADWWLNSGGIMNIGLKEFGTNSGPLPQDSYWRKLYAKTNPKDTDGGYFPQNIFRLVTRSKWGNLSQSVYFNVKNINLSQSSNRNESNGVLLFNRYQDGDNLYYIGLRTDGDAVIKKKISDKYYTLKEKTIFSNGEDYDKEKNPNLIPSNSWIGIRSEVKNIDSKTVDIKLYIDKEQKGEWQLILEARDSQGKFGSAPFLGKGYAGIRTDFMDVQFKNYDIQRM
jgi:hypothetical protein